MSRVSITFRFPEDREEHDRMIAGAGAVTVLVEALRHIRTRLDHGEVDEAGARELEELRRVIVEEARDRRVPID